MSKDPQGPDKKYTTVLKDLQGLGSRVALFFSLLFMATFINLQPATTS